MKTILLICCGNVCRSPMAGVVMKELVKKAELASQFHIGSAVTTQEELGNQADSPARHKLEEQGISCGDHAARQLTSRDDECDLLIGMDGASLRNMYRICCGDYADSMSLLMEHTACLGSVAGPWYTDDFKVTWLNMTESGVSCSCGALSEI